MTSAFFTTAGDELVPAPHARSPWALDMLHGRLLGGLAARAVEDRYGDPEMQFARLTVDLFRNSPMLPVTVETALVRDGRRIRVADAVIRTEQGVIGRASAVLLRKGEQPGGERPVTPAWDETPPDGPPAEGPGWTPPFDLWRLSEWGDPGRRRVWTRENRPLVDDEEVSPFVRVALAADFASPLSGMTAGGLPFINADYTLTLARLPRGEVIGLDATGHLSADGVANGQCTVHDASGPIGYCVVTALANRIPPPPAAR
ncbi:acyl-CoA thioesterase domain-containing protein [Nonomuraea sp. ATR24]|uniref:acyl-CoA thioesterase domain-containing protein n=1 Tax=Nonomuraea sp. ATR24 TaxID=1676744 RepID=UPI0035BFB8D5